MGLSPHVTVGEAEARGAGSGWLHAAPVCAPVTAVTSSPGAAYHGPILPHSPGLMGRWGILEEGEPKMVAKPVVGPTPSVQSAMVWSAWGERGDLGMLGARPRSWPCG